MCLTGYVRTFYVPSVHLSIEAVRRSLNASLFAVVSNDNGDTFKGQSKALNESDLSLARRRVQILDWRVVPRANQFVKLAYCATIVEMHERLARVQFDWVVRLRPDGLYWPVPPGWLRSLDRNTVYQSSNSGDVMWIMPRHALAIMAAKGDTPLSKSSDGDVCCGTLSSRYFECLCEIVRTDIASATIARLGLFAAGYLGNRLDKPERQTWTESLSTNQLAHWPGTGRGIAARNLHRRPNATASDAYKLLDRKPWTAR